MLRNGLEPWQLLIVAIVIIALFGSKFGSKKLPDAVRGLGKSMRSFKSEAKAKKDGDGPRPSAAPENASAGPAPRVVQSAPGETATARPAAESDTVR
ncbi:Sec-independent protein translocase subunit TatA [Streptomyces sp. NPDC001020]